MVSWGGKYGIPASQLRLLQVASDQALQGEAGGSQVCDRRGRPGELWGVLGSGILPPSLPDRRLSPQFSCPSLDAVVNYFVTYTKRALVPFLMEEDYEKVLGVRCGAARLGRGHAVER